MFSHSIADVLRVAKAGSHCEELLVSIDGVPCKAINYSDLTGFASVGDCVVVNTTAVDLNLGSGGYHFVIHNQSQPKQALRGAGHIMKLRYTPMQLRVLAVEEENSPHHSVMKNATSLQGMPVAVAELHSMLAPLVLSLKKDKPRVRLAYLMTDGGALPAFFSRTVRELRERELLCGTITAGHAFGGDLEAVNIYSGLLAARHVLHADVAIVAMGPGVAGTNTPFGFSGLEAADNINRVVSLDGQAVLVPRISFADTRGRHIGLSHHTLTVLATVAAVQADLPLPQLSPEEDSVLTGQVKKGQLEQRHRIYRYADLSMEHLEEDRHLCSTMGRSLKEDSAFFMAVTATAKHLSHLLDKLSVDESG
jgi:hypothetical protein